MKVDNEVSKMLDWLIIIGRLCLSIIVLATISACNVFNDAPTTLALNNVKTLVSMPESEYQLQRKNIELREITSIDYLRARIIQNTKFSFAIENVERVNSDLRDVIVSVSEKRAAGADHERARFRTKLTRDAEGNWKITTFRLIE